MTDLVGTTMFPLERNPFKLRQKLQLTLRI